MVVSRTSDGGTVYFTSDEDAFAPTLEEAVQFGKNNFMLDNLPNTIIEVRVPNSIIQNVYRFGADGMNAISIPTEYLPSLRATPLNYSPLIPYTMIEIKAKIKLYKGRDKRQTSFYSGYRPLFSFIQETKPSGQITLLDKEEFKPGEEGIVKIAFLN